MLQAAASILDIAGQLLPAEDPPRLVPTLQVVFDGAEERRKERLQRTAHEDFDDDEREALQVRGGGGNGERWDLVWTEARMMREALRCAWLPSQHVPCTPLPCRRSRRWRKRRWTRCRS